MSTDGKILTKRGSLTWKTTIKAPKTANNAVPICLSCIFSIPLKYTAKNEKNSKYIPLRTRFLTSSCCPLKVFSVTENRLCKALFQVLSAHDVSLQVRRFRVPNMVIQARHT